MRSIICLIILLLCFTELTAQRVKVTRVFASERQNEMAGKLPEILLKAYAEGNLSAYYPTDPRRPVGLAKFYQHFSGKAKALAVLTAGPAWYCGARVPTLDEEMTHCFSSKFEIGSEVINGKSQPVFVRLIYDASCHPAAIDRWGPVFRVNEMQKLTAPKYRIANPQNAAVTYSASDILLLRLYKDRAPMN